MFLFLIVLIVGAYLFYHYSNNSNAHLTRSSKTDAIEILNIRYAKGEISLEEYLAIKSVLMK